MRVRNFSFAVAFVFILSSAISLAVPQAANAASCNGTNATTFTEIQTGLTAGSTVCLAADLSQSDLGSTAQLFVVTGVPAVLDLNGHSLTFQATPGKAGIRVRTGATLTIADSVGTGVLDVTGGTWLSNTSSGSGIGGDGGSGGSAAVGAGTINITGGTVIAKAGATTGNLTGAAGIGGGGSGNNGISQGLPGNGGTVTISGGVVTATGSTSGLESSGAGIGGGGSLYQSASLGGTLTVIGTGNPLTGGAGFTQGSSLGGTPASVVIGAQPTDVFFTQTTSNATSTAAGASTTIAFSYLVNFSTGSGTAVASQTVPYANTATQPTNPTLLGSTFSGWNLTSPTGPSFSFGTRVLSPLTIFASWNSTASLANTGTYMSQPLVFAGTLSVMGVALLVFRKRRDA